MEEVGHETHTPEWWTKRIDKYEDMLRFERWLASPEMTASKRLLAVAIHIFRVTMIAMIVTIGVYTYAHLYVLQWYTILAMIVACIGLAIAVDFLYSGKLPSAYHRAKKHAKDIEDLASALNDCRRERDKDLARQSQSSTRKIR